MEEKDKDKGDNVLLEDPGMDDNQITKSKAKAALVPLGVQLDGFTTIEVERPRLAMMKLLNLFYVPPVVNKDVHPTAVVDPSAKLGQNVSIGPNVVVSPNAQIGDNTKILANSQCGLCVVSDRRSLESPFPEVSR